MRAYKLLNNFKINLWVVLVRLHIQYEKMKQLKFEYANSWVFHSNFHFEIEDKDEKKGKAITQ